MNTNGPQVGRFVIVPVGAVLTWFGIIGPSNRQPTSPPPTANNADELLKFKQLLDTGAITQEEFDAAKARIPGTVPQQAVHPPFVQMK